MTPPDRKPDQAVEFDGAHLPRGDQEDRSCDLRECPSAATTLVAAPDGSILLVCTEHGDLLTVPAADGAHRGQAQGERVRRLMARVRPGDALRLLLGIALIAWGLSICSSAGGVRDADGVVTGSIGVLLLISVVLPRRRH